MKTSSERLGVIAYVIAAATGASIHAHEWWHALIFLVVWYGAVLATSELRGIGK